MRVGAVDLGTNSTRLLVADVEGGRVTEVVRRLAITRLGEGVDESNQLLPAAIARVHAQQRTLPDKTDRQEHFNLLRRLKFPATAALTPAEAAAALNACLPQGAQETAALLQ